MQFRTLDNEMVDGETWCPGPVPQSVWVLMPDGSTKAVRLANAKVDVAHEIEPPRWLNVQWARLRAQTAPPLPAKAWRSTLAPELAEAIGGRRIVDEPSLFSPDAA